jgi:hypothetical protein
VVSTIQALKSASCAAMGFRPDQLPDLEIDIGHRAIEGRFQVVVVEVRLGSGGLGFGIVEPGFEQGFLFGVESFGAQVIDSLGFGFVPQGGIQRGAQAVALLDDFFERAQGFVVVFLGSFEIIFGGRGGELSSFRSLYFSNSSSASSRSSLHRSGRHRHLRFRHRWTQVEVFPVAFGGSADGLGLQVGIPGLGAGKALGAGELVVGLLSGGQFQRGCGQGGLGLFTVGETRQHIPAFDRLAFADQDFGHRAAHGKGQDNIGCRDDPSLGDDGGIHHYRCFDSAGSVQRRRQSQKAGSREKEDVFFHENNF